MKTYAPALFFAMPLGFVSGALAQRQTFHINPDSSQVAFTLGGSGHHMQGTFHVRSGSIEFDPQLRRSPVPWLLPPQVATAANQVAIRK